MRKILFALCVLACQAASAQRIEVLSVRELPEEIGSKYHVKFSPAGDYLLLTSDNYAGLTKYDLATGQVEVLTDARDAGYGVQMSGDGKNVVYREAVYKNNRKFLSLKSLNLERKKVKKLVSPTRELTAYRVADGRMLYAQDKKIKSKKIVSTPEETVVPVAAIEDRQLVLYRNGERTVLSPNGTDASYIWPSVSPDGRHIVYVVAGKGTYVSTCEGKDVKRIGRINAPVWLGNSLIVGMKDKDNGEYVTSSSIVSVDIEGNNYQELTGSDRIAMFPATSADSSRIAYNTDKGEVFVMQVRIK